MKGHEAIIAMRKSGKTPKYVFLNDYPCETNWFETGDHATVCVHGDAISSLDLRFLIGLVVSISSTDENRAKRLLEACKPYAQSAGAGCSVMVNEYRAENTWSEVWHKETANA